MKQLWLLLVICFFLVGCGSEVAPEPIYEEELEAAPPAPTQAVPAPGVDPETVEEMVVEEPAEPLPPREEQVPEPSEEEESETVEKEDLKEAPSQPVEIGVAIQGFAFAPKTLEVKKGTTVTWVNQDNAPHTVSGSTFDSGTLSKGQTFSHTFDADETVNYICNIHPSMTGEVVVT